MMTNESFFNIQLPLYSGQKGLSGCHDRRGGSRVKSSRGDSDSIGLDIHLYLHQASDTDLFSSGGNGSSAKRRGAVNDKL